MDKVSEFTYQAGVALFIYMPFHIFLSQWLSTFTGGLNGWKVAKDVLTAVVFALVIGILLWTRAYTRKFLIILGLSLAYTALHLILLKTTDQPNDTGILATVYNSRLFWYLLIGYGLSLMFPGRLTPRKIFRWTLMISTVVCLVAMAQWFLPKDLMTNFGYSLERGVKPAFFIDDKDDLPRVFSTIRDPNSLGAFLILPITLLAYGLTRFWNTNKRQLIIGLLLLHGLVLTLTFSRSAFAGALLSVAVMLALMNKKSLKKFVRANGLQIGAITLVIVGLLFSLRDQYFIQNVIFHSDENTTAQQDSNEKHVSLAQQGIRGAADQPLGQGPGTAGLVSIHNRGLLTENYYIQIAYEVGLIGLAIFLTLLAIVVKELWRLRHNYPGALMISSFVALAAINMLLHTWTNEAVSMLWFFTAGAVLGHSYKRSKTDFS